MKKFNWYILLIIIIILLELLEVLIPLPLLLIAVISIASFESTKTASFFAFACGIVSDIGDGRNLGIGSLFFLAVVFIVYLYRQKVRQESSGFIIVLTFLFTQGFLLAFKRNGYFYPVEGIISSILSIPITSFFFQIKPKDLDL